MSVTTTSIDDQQIPRGISIREFAKSQDMAEASIRRRVGTGQIPSYKVCGARRIPLAYLEQLQRGALTGAPPGQEEGGIGGQPDAGRGPRTTSVSAPTGSGDA